MIMQSRMTSQPLTRDAQGLRIFPKGYLLDPIPTGRQVITPKYRDCEAPLTTLYAFAMMVIISFSKSVAHASQMKNLLRALSVILLLLHVPETTAPNTGRAMNKCYLGLTYCWAQSKKWWRRKSVPTPWTTTTTKNSPSYWKIHKISPW